MRRLAIRLTILVEDLFSRRLPLCLGQHFHHDNVAVDGSVHAFPSNEENLLVVCRGADGALRLRQQRPHRVRLTHLEVIVRIGVKVSLVENSAGHAGLQRRLREVLHQESAAVPYTDNATYIIINPPRCLPPRRMPVAGTRRDEITQLDLQLVRQSIDVFSCRRRR